MTSVRLITLAGFALVAVTYGLARYSLGLLMPDIMQDLSFSASRAGLVAGISFAGYCVAILVTPLLTQRFGAKAVAVTSGLVAASGLILSATSAGLVGLSVGVFVAGLSSGLISPALAALVTANVAPLRRDTINTMINAGTGGGVLLAGPAALLLGADWRFVLAVFSVFALLTSACALLALPGGTHPLEKNVKRCHTPIGGHAPLAAFMLGMGSTSVWSFGGTLTANSLGWTGQEIGFLWAIIGAAGIAGVVAGPLVARFGIDTSHRALLILIAASIPLVGIDATTDVVALAGGAAFGAAFIAVSGVYLLWAIADAPGRPAEAVMRAFVVLAFGQAVGAPLFGAALSGLGTNNAVWLFAALTLISGYVSRGAEKSAQVPEARSEH